VTISTPISFRLNECVATPAHVLATASGPIQYAERGHGQATLIVHGAPGGYDQGLVGLEFWGRDRARKGRNHADVHRHTLH
jgi:hypothetical protein